MRPPISLTRKINPDAAADAGPVLYGWARRTARAMPSNARQIRALVKYLPLVPASTYTALGGQETLDWATSMLQVVGMSDEPLPMRENEIAVLGLPYGGPDGGKDSQGYFFDDRTEFMEEALPYPPVYKTHGTSNGFSAEPIGTTTGRWYDEQGGWFRVRLDPQSPEYANTLEAYRKGSLFSSSGAIPASYSEDEATGHVKTWLVGELSLVDTRDGYAPVNRYAITKATVALFEDEYGDIVSENTTITRIRDLAASLLDAIRDYNGLMLPDGSTVEVPTDIQKATETTGEDPMAVTEKCESCEEAARLAEETRAEIAKAEADAASQKCVRCPDAIRWTRDMFKAGKISPKEAREYLDIFEKSDELYDEARERVEKAAVVDRTQKAFIAGGQGNPKPDEVVDEAWIAAQKLK